MKNYRNVIGSLVLTFVFSTFAFAGEGIMWTEKTPPPPPPPTAQADGIIQNGMAEPAPEGSALTEITLSLLQTLLPLL